MTGSRTSAAATPSTSAARGYRLVREFVIAESADDAEVYERADFEAAIADVVAHRAEIDVVVFWKVDRISRGGVLPYFTLKGVLAKHDVRVEFATEQIDGSASGELMETLLAGMARFENKPEVLSGPFDIVQIGLVCVLGYADFRFADCGWRKAYPKLDAFHQKVLERPSVKISLPPAA